MLNRTAVLMLQSALMAANWSRPQPSPLPFFPLSSSGTEEDNICFGELGCFPLSFPWIDTNRPVANLPFTPQQISPKFCLYTRHNPDVCQPLRYDDPSSVYKSDLVPSHRVYFVAHGFLENGFKSWIKMLTLRLLQRADVNVIAVDWGGGSKPVYTQAVANIRVVGTITAHLIANLHKWVGVKPEYIHIIGHSLGAHLAGYAGNILRSRFGLRLGRITGLDPADPHFSQTDPLVRLDPTDAIYVDVIHTDTSPFIERGFGIAEPVGHFDFYPNGGNLQPGCNEGLREIINQEDGSILKGVRKYLGCNHVRSYQYFIESLREKCPFIAIECDSYASFKAGKCFKCRSHVNDGLICAQMGLRSNRAAQTGLDPQPARRHVQLFTITNSSKPFCLSLYRITVVLSNSTISREHGGEVGIFSIVIDGVMNKTHDIPLFDGEQAFEPGAQHTEVVGGIQVGRIRGGVLKWAHPVSFNILTWRINVPYLYVDRVIVDNLEEDHTAELCLDNENSSILSQVPLNLRPCATDPTQDFV